MCVCVCMCACMHVCVHMRVCMCVFAHVCVHSYECICMCLCKCVVLSVCTEQMGVYMTFPVGLFYYFNQPQFFEDWMIEKRVSFNVKHDLVLFQGVINENCRCACMH